MTEFKKGDLVECVEANYQEGWPFTLHKAYEVLDTSEDDVSSWKYIILTDDNGNTVSYRDEYFKLFKFKENDMVICKVPAVSLTVGKTYKVLKELEDIGKSFVKVNNDDDGDARFYMSSHFILTDAEPKFKIVIEGYTMDEMLDKIEEAADVLNDAVKLEKVYPKLRDLLDDKTLPLDLF